MSTVKPKFKYSSTEDTDLENHLNQELMLKSLIVYGSQISHTSKLDQVLAISVLFFTPIEAVNLFRLNLEKLSILLILFIRFLLRVILINAYLSRYNAKADYFFRFLKSEELNRKSFSYINAVNICVFEYMHFYNSLRPYSFHIFLSPNK